MIMSTFEIKNSPGTTFDLSVSSYDNTTNKIAVIKAIRGLTGLGLKDAKDIADEAVNRKQHITVTQKLSAGQIHEWLMSIENAGAAISSLKNGGNYEKYVSQLKEISVAATLAGDYYVSSSINEMLDHRFLRYAQNSDNS
jgi:hypothetical protein